MVYLPIVPFIKFGLDLWSTFANFLLFKYIHFLWTRLPRSPISYRFPSLSGGGGGGGLVWGAEAALVRLWPGGGLFRSKTTNSAFLIRE